MPAVIRAMTIDDLDEVLSLWSATEGVGLNESDTLAALVHYLARNPQMSIVACESSQIVGAVLCGHDGRRGYLNHLAVSRQHRGQGIGRQLVERCLGALSALGILRCNIFLYVDNEAGKRFWDHLGWSPRQDLQVFQRATAL